MSKPASSAARASRTTSSGAVDVDCRPKRNGRTGSTIPGAAVLLVSVAAALQSGERSGASDAGRRGEVMLKNLGSPDGVLAVEVVGKLEKDDYVSVHVPGLQVLLDAYGAIRCVFVFVFGDQYAGLTVGGTVEDSKLYLFELAQAEAAIEWAGHRPGAQRPRLVRTVRSEEPAGALDTC
jgi:hypothetical protein